MQRTQKCCSLLFSEFSVSLLFFKRKKERKKKGTDRVLCIFVPLVFLKKKRKFSKTINVSFMISVHMSKALFSR